MLATHCVLISNGFPQAGDSNSLCVDRRIPFIPAAITFLKELLLVICYSVCVCVAVFVCILLSTYQITFQGQ